MEISLTIIIGLVAAICTTISFLPQAISIIKTKQARDISLVMYIILNFGIFCWIIYGILTESLPILLANTITLFLVATILILKIRYK